MSIVLFIFSVLAFIGGASLFAASQNAIHETEALVMFVIATLFFVGAAIVDAIGKLGKKS